MANTKIPSELVAINAISGTLIADNAITSVHIAENNITATQIAINAVTALQMADGTITSAKIADGTIVTADIADGQITTGKIADGTITTDDLAGGIIISSKIANNAILTQHIDDNQITADQIADNAVGVDQLAGITRGSVLTGNAAGNPSLLALGAANTLLQSDGTDLVFAPLQSGIDDNSNAVAITIDSSERVGIGGAPSFTFQVKSPSSTAYNAYNFLTSPNIAFSNATSGAGKYNSLLFGTESNGEVAIGSVQNSSNIAADLVVAIRSGGNRLERMRITSDGNVGIGTTAPSEKLVVNVNSTGIKAGLILNNQHGYGSGVGVAATALQFARDNSPDNGQAIISGQIYSGNENETTSNPGMMAFSTKSGTSPYTVTEHMRISSTGNVGIGTTNPQFDLDVTGLIRATSDVYLQGDVYVDSKIRHNGDVDNYITFSAADTQGFITGNSTRLQITNSLVRFNQENNNQDFSVYSANSDNMLYVDASTDRVGIGTASPTTTLSVVNDSTNEGFNVRHSNNTAGIGIGYNTIQATGTNTNQSIYLMSKGAADILFYTNGQQRLHIDSLGTVGIGATSGEANLVVRDRVDGTHKGGRIGFGIHEAGALQIYDAVTMSKTAGSVVTDSTASGGQNLTLSSGQLYGPYHTLPRGQYRLCVKMKTTNAAYTGDAARLTCHVSSGTVIPETRTVRGVDFGTNNKWQTFSVPFQVVGAATNAVEFYLFALNSQAISVDYFFIMNDTDSYSTKVYGDQIVDGNVGIGTTTPGNFYSGAEQLVVHRASGEAGITVSTANNTTGALYFADGTTSSQAYMGGMAYAHTTDVLTLVSGGVARVNVATAGHLYPNVNNTMDLGLNDKRWKDLYLSGKISTNTATGLSITADSNNRGILNLSTSQAYQLIGGTHYGYTGYKTGGYHRWFGSDGAEDMRINSSGDLEVQGGAVHIEGRHISATQGAYKKSMKLGTGGNDLYDYERYYESWNTSTETINVFETSHDTANWGEKYIKITVRQSLYNGGGYAEFYLNHQYNTNSLQIMHGGNKYGSNSSMTAQMTSLTTVTGNVKKSTFQLVMGYYQHAYVTVQSNMTTSTSITAANQLKFF